ncbi:MAG: stage II sporulation protein M [Acidobacteria bacterium]|nr:stage II sporulation protein M [Acidobacteriota bacterium]
MLIDLPRFVNAERPHWQALEDLLKRFENDPDLRLPVDEAQRFHYLYQRTGAALSRISTFASEPELKRYLEWLVSRAYSVIHGKADRRRFHPWRWFTVTLPTTFRRRFHAFQMSVALTLLGCLFGVIALAIDPEAKSALMPFAHLAGRPSERVAQENANKGKNLDGHKTSFSAHLMTHNTQVAILTMGLGISYGIGTIIMLFYNGVILGAVAFDYVMDGQTVFLLGWLLPHGVIEIPAILLGGQAGFLIAHALIGWGDRRISRAQRLRAAAPDIVTIIGGAAVFLVWAGIIEAFFSQYHEPVLPYGVKIAFGCAELAGLIFFLWKGGTAPEPRG